MPPATIYGPDQWGALQIPLPAYVTTWAKNTAYTVGAVIVPQAPTTGFYFVATVAGTSAAGPPGWPTAKGSQITDGTVTWQCQGLAEVDGLYAGQAAGDPCLYFIGSFLATFLGEDENVTAQWTISGVAPGLPPVQTVVIGKPNDEGYSFRRDALPSLFLWRETQDTGWLADGIFKDETVLKMLWVYPQGQPQNTRVRLPFQNAIVKGIFAGIERGRTPSWLQIGETETFALGGELWTPGAEFTQDQDQCVPSPPNGHVYTCTVTGITGGSQPVWPTDGSTVTDNTCTWIDAGLSDPQGSLVYTYAGFGQLNLEKSKPATVRIKDQKGKPIGNFPAVEMTWKMLEVENQGITNRVPNVNSGTFSVSLANEVGGITFPNIVEGQTLPGPSLTALSPDTGNDAGGTAVTLTGTGFLAGATVSFGAATVSQASVYGTVTREQLATNVVVVSSTEITCNSPASVAAWGGPGPVRVIVQNYDGQSTNPMLFTFTP